MYNHWRRANSGPLDLPAGQSPYNPYFTLYALPTYQALLLHYQFIVLG